MVTIAGPDGAPLPESLGPYRIEGLLGSGGMGEVYRGRDTRLGRAVAIKRVRADARERSSTARRRLRREARAVARVRHKAIVQIYDLIEDESDDWIVMELVRGRSLREILADGPLLPERVAAIGRRVAAGLAAAHHAGLVHRDLKAENVMVCAGDEVKILDFGVVKSFAEDDSLSASISMEGQVLGTVTAMSPEQAMGSPVDHRSDLFSLGTLLYELLTGVSPFEGPDPFATLTRICTAREVPIQERNPAVPEALSRVVQRLLLKDRAHRPQTASEVEAELAGIALAGSPEPGLARRPGIEEGLRPLSRDPAVEIRPDLIAAYDFDESLSVTGEASAWTGMRDGALRTSAPPKLPSEPYPALGPYAHPALLAGRDREIALLRRRLRLPVPVLCLYASAGTGKSSLLLAGLVPELRAAGTPVAVDRRPQEAGIASRLLQDLLDGAEPLADGDWQGFTELLEQVEDLAELDLPAGSPHGAGAPVLVLDQFESVLRAGPAARSRLGILLAATARRRPGTESPPCRWILAYRPEVHNELTLWLRDVLAETDRRNAPEMEELPRDLSGGDRSQTLALAPVATATAGSDALEEATRAFQEVIEKPFTLSDDSGKPVFSPPFAAGHAERLARAFAEERLRRPEMPLVPQLQVVLAHLRKPGESEEVEVARDPGPVIAAALEDHLLGTLEASFPEADDRLQALLALYELASEPRQDRGLPAGDVARGIGGDAQGIFDRLAAPSARLVVAYEASEGLRWALAHGCFAEGVARAVEGERLRRRHGLLRKSAWWLALGAAVLAALAWMIWGLQGAP